MIPVPVRGSIWSDPNKTRRAKRRQEEKTGRYMLVLSKNAEASLSVVAMVKNSRT